jgi:hypothetical protein
LAGVGWRSGDCIRRGLRTGIGGAMEASITTAVTILWLTIIIIVLGFALCQGQDNIYPGMEENEKMNAGVSMPKRLNIRTS